MRKIIGRAYAGDLVRDVEHGRGELASDHVGLVALGDRKDEIGVPRARLLKYRRMRGVAADGAKVEPVLESLQPLEVDIDNGDVICF